MRFLSKSSSATPSGKPSKGFTLVELLVVLAIIASLLTVAVPRYFNSVDHSKEVALLQDLQIMRDAIDKFYGDQGRYPSTLDELVKRGYLRGIPEDPITNSKTSWRTLLPPTPGEIGIYDVKSSAPGTAKDGSRYDQW